MNNCGYNDCFSCPYDECRYEPGKAKAKTTDRSAYYHEYYMRNREKNLARAKKYYQENHEKCVDRHRKYYQEHREERNQYSREYYYRTKGGKV